MASASAPCEKCDRGSYRCEGCRGLFCNYHFSEHRRDLAQQLDSVEFEQSNLKEILNLPPSYQSLTESTDLLDKINQWEIDTIHRIKEAAEQARGKVRQRSDTTPAERFEPELCRLTEELHQTRQTDHFTELDIQRFMKQLKDLKLEIEDSLSNTAEIQTTTIDWTKLIQVVAKQQKLRKHQQNIKFDRLITTRPRISLNVRGSDDWHLLGGASSPNSTFLHYQHNDHDKQLSIVDVHGQEKPIPWHEGQSIWDSCWSPCLDKFIILTDSRLYTYDETAASNSIQLIEVVKPRKNEMEFLRCACSNETILITYDERRTSVDEYNITEWTLIRKHEAVVKQNEIIIGIAISETNSNLVGLTVRDDRQHWHFELKNRLLQLISSIQLDKNQLNRPLISLPNTAMNWLIVHTGSKFFTVIDERAQTKRTIECPENIDLATFIADKNCLVTLTQKNKLKFFDL